eukprot:SAG31_NODE_5116_length_2731_cov_1.876900_2_plen_70_part_00
MVCGRRAGGRAAFLRKVESQVASGIARVLVRDTSDVPRRHAVERHDRWFTAVAGSKVQVPRRLIGIDWD